jgi:hypothetical protein
MLGESRDHLAASKAKLIRGISIEGNQTLTRFENKSLPKNINMRKPIPNSSKLS